MVSKKRRGRRDKVGYSTGSEETTEARAHGFDDNIVYINERKEGKSAVKEDRKDDKRDYKLDKTAQKTELIRAKGTRLKWLVILIGLIMAGFGAFKAGLFGG